MEVIVSGTEQCAIVGIGDLVRRLTQETGQEYLALNRGINAVVNIDLSEVVKSIDFNSPEIQIYPPTTGFPALKDAINKEYFGGKANPNQISITGGGMAAIDMAFQTVKVDKVFVPEIIWESYFMIMQMRGKQPGLYHSLSSLKGMIDELRGNAVLICDPSNPVGDKYDDEKLFELIKFLNDNDVVVFCDCPYRRIFKDADDSFYERLLPLENVVHTEIMFDPQTHTKRGVSFETVISGIKRAQDGAEKNFGITSYLIMSYLRHLSEEDAFETFEQSLPYKHLIKAVGLDSSEKGNPPSKFQKVFAASVKEGYKIVAHAGEEGPAIS